MTYCVAALEKISATATAIATAIRYAIAVAPEKMAAIAAAHVSAIQFVGVVALKKMTTTAIAPAIRCVSAVAVEKMDVTAVAPVVAIRGYHNHRREMFDDPVEGGTCRKNKSNNKMVFV